jgi:multicomponent Na+:H+ antiporter subunit B
VNRTLRIAVFLVGAGIAGALFAWGMGGLPSFGHYPGPYGDEIVRRTGPERHATNAVTTVVLDFRNVDTAGEELILLAAAVGVLMLLRRQKEERVAPPDEYAEGRRAVDPSVPVRVVSATLVAPAALLGLYLVAHGQLTPGGGFQGGVVLAVPSILVFLAARFRSFEALHPSWPWEAAQAVAVTGFLVAGFAPMLAGRAFLTNVLPLGSTGTVFSAGIIPVLNLLIGPAVATAIVLIALELIEQVTEIRGK